MDPVHLIWLYGAGALVGGAVIGAIFYRNLAPSRKETENLKQELEQSREELSSYRASVDEHFNKTSGLVNQLTQDYVKVYQHLAEGAQTLGSNPDFGHRLEQHQGKVLISMDAEAPADDTIVSDQPATEQQPTEPPRDFSPPQDDATPAEDSAPPEDTAPSEETPPEAASPAKPDKVDGDPPAADNREASKQATPESAVDPEISAPEIDESKVTVKTTDPKEPTLLH